MRPLRVALFPLAALLSVMVASCSRQLDRNRAAALITTHLTALTPATAESHAYRVEVEEIVTVNEFERQGRFRLTSWTRDTVADTTELITAVFRRSDRGWTLAQYGPLMRDAIVELLWSEWRERYRDLIDAFLIVDRAYSEWAGSLSERFNDREKAGPDTLELGRLIDSIGGLEGDQIVWGYAKPLLPSRWKPVIWVALADSESVECGQKMGYDSRSGVAGTGHYWLPDGIGETSVACRGRGEVFSLELSEELKQRIDSSGGILLR